MAISQLPQAPYRQDRRVYPTPIIGDVLFSEVRDCTRSEIPEYGTPHPNPKKWPDHKLVFVKPVDIERDGIFEFFYAAERENQDLYNFSSGYRNVVGNAGGREFRVVQRSYVTLRDKFQPMDIEFATPMMNVPEGKFDDVEYVFFDRQQQQIQEQELNALFVAEVHTYIEKAFLEYKLSYGTQKSEVVPEKFRALIPQTTTEQIVEGLAEQPVLTGSQLSVTEDQINPDIKVVKTVSRADQQTGYVLSGKQVTNLLQVADVVETIVPDGTTIETTALTVDGSVESLGNGQSIQRVITAPELFTAESYSVQRPDPVPEKFRVLAPTENIEETVEGAAAMPTLTAGELQVSEQQLNVHVKRKSRTKRDVTTLPKSITQKVTTNEKQIATITDTLQVGDTDEAPTALKDIQSDALGDGTYIVRKTEVPNLFNNKTVSIERPEVLPERFRAEAQILTEIENKLVSSPEQLDDVVNENDIFLEQQDLAIRRQKINEFVYSEQKTKRRLSDNQNKLEGSQSYVEGTRARIKEEILSDGDNLESDTGFYVEQSKVSPLGGGKFLKETVSVNQWPTLLSADWDDTINGFSVKKQTVEDPNSSSVRQDLQIPNTRKKVQYAAVNEDRVIRVEEYAPKEIVNYLSSSKTRINLNLPPVLKKIDVFWEYENSVGSYNEKGTDEVESVTDGTVGVSSSGQASSSSGVQPILDIVTEQVWASDLVATNYFYFVENPNNYLFELNKIIGSGTSIREWPIFKTKSYSLTAVGSSASVTSRFSKSKSISKSADREAISQSDGKGTSYGYNSNVDVIRISPCLCAGITVDGDKKTNSVLIGGTSTGTSANGRIFPTSLDATSPPDIPRSGLYAVDSRVEPYKWGYYRAIVTVIDASQFA